MFETSSPLEEIADINRELVRRVATEDRNTNRDIYDALEDEYLTSSFIGEYIRASMNLQRPMHGLLEHPSGR